MPNNAKFVPAYKMIIVKSKSHRFNIIGSQQFIDTNQIHRFNIIHTTEIDHKLSS